jgi:hypothetical protein
VALLREFEAAVGAPPDAAAFEARLEAERTVTEELIDCREQGWYTAVGALRGWRELGWAGLPCPFSRCPLGREPLICPCPARPCPAPLQTPPTAAFNTLTPFRSHRVFLSYAPKYSSPFAAPPGARPVAATYEHPSDPEKWLFSVEYINAVSS